MSASSLNTLSRGKSPLAFLLLAVVIYLPFALFAGVEVFPNWTLLNFGAFIPMLVALILVLREEGAGGAMQLLGRAFDFKRIRSKMWYLPIFLTIPFTVSVLLGWALAAGLPVSSPYLPSSWPLLFVILFVAAIGEELGWMGYLFEPMQERLGALKAGILLGILWALIHIPMFASSSVSASWIMSQLIYVAATRILFVWVYNNSGKSVFAVVMMHALFNSVWFLFPRNEAWAGLARPVFYNPTGLALITIVLAGVVTFLWGSRTLAEYRFSRSS